MSDEYQTKAIEAFSRRPFDREKGTITSAFVRFVPYGSIHRTPHKGNDNSLQVQALYLDSDQPSLENRPFASYAASSIAPILVEGTNQKGGTAHDDLKAGPDLLPLAAHGDAGPAGEACLHGGFEHRWQRTTRCARGLGRGP